MSAIDFADLADVYVSARPPRREGSPLVLTFVLAVALELALKAVLREDGATESELRAISHDVEAAHARVMRAHAPKRLRATPARARVLALLRVYYAPKHLEYTPVGSYEVPKLYALRGLVREAIAFALDHVYGAGTYQRRQRTRGVKIGATQTAYGNASRRELQRRLRRRFDELAESFLGD